MRSKAKIILALNLVLLACPDYSPAFQSHSAPEGLYAHQMAHVFLVAAMSFFVYWLEAEGFVKDRGWRLIQTACILLCVWSLATTVGHWVEEQIPNAVLVGEPDWRQRISMSVSPWVAHYYVLKLDHFISVPAIICLFLGVKSLYEEALREDRRTNG